ncbi:MAG: ferrous iron transport protein B [Clostridiales bacterium]|nr:ferrous iron transport protein B [Candidatus Crickella caballi]
MKIALAGNPNSGKTTLFNDLTGSNQYVGNWPGVTVEKKDGKLINRPEIIIQDLPGIYSLSPYTLEEVVTRKYLVEERPDAIINIIDATSIERSLYLTTQLLELGIPVVIALNMMDLVEKNGDTIDIGKLSKELRCPIVPITALRKCGCFDAANEAIALAQRYEQKEAPHIYSGEVEHALAHIEESIDGLIPDNVLRWYAIKLFERDPRVLEELKDKLQGDHTNRLEGHPNADHTHPTGEEFDLWEHLEEHIKECEAIMDEDSESVIINERYDYVEKACMKSVHRKHKAGELTTSDKIDLIFTHRIWALPIFAAVMFLVYYISITLLGTAATDWTNDVLFGTWIQPAVGHLLEGIGASSWVISMVVDGIIGGLAAPIGFAPQMAIVFLFLSFLEDCGYMSRVAFVMDRAFRRFGLSGKSFIPFLISSGCGVPGIMGTRTIENVKDRRMTMIVTTMIPCGAKMPIIAAIAGYISGGLWWLAPTMYFAGIGMVIVSCLILKKTKKFAGEPAPFVMELPKYHMPLAMNMLRHTWERVWEFLKKAGTILFICCAIMWFLSNFGFTASGLGPVSAADSLMAKLGGFLSWLFIPLGFGNWQAVAASISGFVAKEGIVSTMGVLAGVSAADAAGGFAFAAFLPNAIAAVSFLIFNLFDSPCFAAITTMAQEMGDRKYFWFAIGFQNLMGYSAALIVYQVIGLFTGTVPFTWMTILGFAALAGIIYLIARPTPKEK